MLSKSCQYGIRAVLYLAAHTNEENKVGVKELASDIQVPVHFLAKILQDLSRKDIISSTKGPNGGFYMTEKNLEQPMLQVVRIIDGLAWFTECVLGLNQCDSRHPCPIHKTIQPVKNNLHHELSSHSIKEYAIRLENGETFISLP